MSLLPCSLTYLLEEGDDLTSAPLVWFRQVEVFEVDDDPFAVPRTIDTSPVGGYRHAHLRQAMKQTVMQVHRYIDHLRNQLHVNNVFCSCSIKWWLKNKIVFSKAAVCASYSCSTSEKLNSATYMYQSCKLHQYACTDIDMHVQI